MPTMNLQAQFKRRCSFFKPHVPRCPCQKSRSPSRTPHNRNPNSRTSENVHTIGSYIRRSLPTLLGKAQWFHLDALSRRVTKYHPRFPATLSASFVATAKGVWYPGKAHVLG